MKDEYGLTPKQRAFCDYYVANRGNATQAAKDAGYKGTERTLTSVGNENLTKPDIIAYLQAQDKIASAKRLVDKDEALAILSQISRGEADKDTDEIVPYAVRAKAAEVLLKVYGAFIEKKQVEVSGAMPVMIRDDVHD